MSFLAPWALALAGLAAVPLLLHLLRREVVQRVAFPALRYLRNAEERTARTKRLRDLLLLATRLLLVILLAIAAARPLAGRGGAEDHGPTDVVMLVDNSASMSRVREGRTLLDHQLDMARSALRRASPADRFWIVPTSGPPVAAGTGAAAALSSLDSLAVTEAAADLPGVAALATSAVPVVDGRFRELQVYTDGQATGLAGRPLDLGAWGPVAVSVDPASAGPNAFVADVRLEPDGVVVPGDPPSVAVAVGMDRDGPATPQDTLEVRLLVDGRTVALARAVPGSEALIQLPDLEPGPHSIRAEIPPSGLRADDVRRIGIVAAAPPVVATPGAGDGFLATALRTLAADGRVLAEGPDPILVLEGSGPAAPGRASAIVLVPPAELTRLPAFQQRLDALGVPWRMAGRAAAGETGLREADGLPGLADVRVATSYGLEPLAAPATDADSVLLRTTDGEPWLVRGRVGDRVYLLLASPLTPEATTLPVSAAMMPLVERVVLHWTRPSSAAVRSVDAGSSVPLPPRIEALEAPDGTRRPAEGGAPWTPLHAGAWTLLLPGQDGPIRRSVGVNVPATESALRTAARDGIREAFAGSDVVVAASPDAWIAAVYASRRGGEATLWVVALIFAAGLAELVLAAPRRRADSSVPDAA